MEMMESRIANLENLRKAGTIVLSVKDSQKTFSIKNTARHWPLSIILWRKANPMSCDTRPNKKRLAWPMWRPLFWTIGLSGYSVTSYSHDGFFHRQPRYWENISNVDGASPAANLAVQQGVRASLQPLASKSFICLEPIDAGILQSGEDIIAIVLARMFNYLQQSTNGNNLHARYQEELRGLYREFDKLYQNLCRLRKGGGHFMEENLPCGNCKPLPVAIPRPENSKILSAIYWHISKLWMVVKKINTWS